MFNNNLTYYITKELNCLSSFLQCLLCYIATQFSLCGNLASPALTLLHFTPVQPPADLRPRGASCWNNNSRSGLRSACRFVCQAENGAESGRCRCCRHIFPTHSRDRILGRRHYKKKYNQPFLPYFSPWSDLTAGQWRATSWPGSSCSGCPWAPPCLPGTSAVSIS